MATPDGGDDTEKVNERQSQNEELLSEDENDDDDQSVTSSSSSSSNSSSSDSSSSSDENESETVASTSQSSNLRTCPLRSLMTNSGDPGSYSPISADFPEYNDTTGPVDPVFVDEESSGEAVASAADHEDLDEMTGLQQGPCPPLPELVHEKPPLPNEDEPEQKRARLDDSNLTDKPTENNQVEDEEYFGEVAEEHDDDYSSYTTDEDLLEELLENELDISKIKQKSNTVVPYAERIKFKMIEKRKNHFDVLPQGWVKIDHDSGVPIYLHRPSRSVTISRPYCLGTASARRHPIPKNAIPCMYYKKALEDEEASRQKEKSPFPTAKVESVEENLKTASLNPTELREYCEKLFKFKKITVKKFNTWGDRRTYNKQAQQVEIEKVKKAAKDSKDRPAFPEGTTILSIPVVEMEQENPNGQPGNKLVPKVIRKSKKDWMLNPAGKSTVCILHEYLQHSLKQAPTYEYSENSSSATPYSATVKINGKDYGKGDGSSKKEAKSEAARKTLEIFIPELKNKLPPRKGYVKKESLDLSMFDQISIVDPRVSELCNKTSEPSPYQILLTCLQKNIGKGDTNIVTRMVPMKKKHQQSKYIMELGAYSVEVVCRNKKDGKQRASQKMLAKLHPEITSFGGLLKLYGSQAAMLQKNKKEKESEVTGLQTARGAPSHTSPNVAILAKLRAEMKILAESKKSRAPIGNLTRNPILIDPKLMPSTTDTTVNMTPAVKLH